jgi:mRNA interferase RelE/StbE
LAWTVEYLSATRKQLKRLDPKMRDRIVRFMRERIIEPGDPYAVGSALTGEWAGHWRYRVADHRVICKLWDEKLVVMVVKVGHRSDVYR